MDQPNNIDNLFRQRLQGAEVVPPDFVWANVERAIQPRKRRRFFLWLFAAVFTGGTLLAFWLTSNPTGTPSENPAAQPAENTKPVAESPRVASSAQLPQSTADPSGLYPGERAQSEQISGQAPGTQASKKPRTPNRKSKKGQNGSSAVEFVPPNNYSSTDTEILPLPVEPSSSTDFRLASLMPRLPVEQPLLAAQNPKPNLSPIAIPPIKKKSPKKCYDFHSNRQAWLLDAYAGPSFVSKRLDTSNPEYKSYAQDRQNSETHQWAYNAGVRASYLFAENFIVRTGLHYDQFVEQFEYIDPNFIKYTVVITQQYINGQWISAPDTVDIQYGSNYVKTYNRFTLLDIPLQAALELRSGPMGISLNLGGSVNVLFRKRGDLLSIDGKPIDLEQYEVFRPKVGLSLLGSIQWFYHIQPRTRVFAEPYYRHILNPVNQSGYPVEQTYGISGIRIGLTQIFD